MHVLVTKQRPHFYVDSLDDATLDPVSAHHPSTSSTAVHCPGPGGGAVTVTAAAAISSRLSDSEFSDIDENGLPRGHGQLPGIDPTWSARR